MNDCFSPGIISFDSGTVSVMAEQQMMMMEAGGKMKTTNFFFRLRTCLDLIEIGVQYNP